MKCPACGNDLSHIDVSGVEVDTCDGGCGGVWFDKYQFKKFDEPHEHAGESLLDISRNPSVTIDQDEKRGCPRCENVTMMRHFFSVKKLVEIDECASCAGVWLDTGELATLRSLYPSEEARREAAEAVFDDLLGPKLEALTAAQEKDVGRTRRFANMLKYICPSYYISGKQDWGAF
jgi:Zn-finger nucleic acid-binding protein